MLDIANQVEFIKTCLDTLTAVNIEFRSLEAKTEVEVVSEHSFILVVTSLTLTTITSPSRKNVLCIKLLYQARSCYR
jgi:hypothetical protein